MGYKYMFLVCNAMVNEPAEEKGEQPDIPKFKTNPVYRDMFPKYSEAEIETLKTSIKTFGQLHPIYVNDEDEILDGYKRYEACLRLGISPKYIRIKFDSKEGEVLFILECNLNRRDLNAFQRIEAIVLHREPIERERAAKRKSSGLKQGNRSPMAQIDTYGDEGRIREILAPAARVGDITYYKGSWLIRHGSAQIIDKLRKDIMKIDRAYTLLRSHREQQETRPFKGEVVKMNAAILLIRGPVREVDEATIPKRSLDVIFPSADCSTDKKLMRDIAIFAHRSLRRGGCLVLYASHGSLGTVLSTVAKHANDLELIHALPVVFGSD